MSIVHGLFFTVLTGCFCSDDVSEMSDGVDDPYVLCAPLNGSI
jgi:hypothetical protein